MTTIEENFTRIDVFFNKFIENFWKDDGDDGDDGDEPVVFLLSQTTTKKRHRGRRGGKKLRLKKLKRLRIQKFFDSYN
jgi:hypothetical protein